MADSPFWMRFAARLVQDQLLLHYAAWCAAVPRMQIGGKRGGLVKKDTDF
jgi:hypothetical protein